MPHSALFAVVETGGGGDCAYTSIAKLARTDAKPCDLKPGGRLQGYLRCEAAKWVRGHADMFGGPEAASSFATKVSTTGEWADTPSLFALAKALKVPVPRLLLFA